MTLDRLAGELHLPAGFAFSSLAAGIKASGRPDLAWVQCSPGTKAAALFTSNRVVAAPVLVARAALKASRGRVRALVVNAGNANCATGGQGLRVCHRVCEQASRLLGVPPAQVFPSSTGIIGVPLPGEKILAKLPALVAQQESSKQAVRDWAHAIMTTDTRPKLASISFRVRNREARLLGIAKGSGMIHPQLATMLVFLFTDVVADSKQLRRLLTLTCDRTFNCLSIDGDTSTNDTALLLASGQSGMDLAAPRVEKFFREALGSITQSLAEQIVSDGEGVHHVIRLAIDGAKNRKEAMQIARAIAHSPLVKTSWAGGDPNWGRILAAIGKSGVPVDPEEICIFIGRQRVCHYGRAHIFDRKDAHRHLSQAACDIRVQLNRGIANLQFLTTDLSSDYVHINAGYST